MGYLSRCAGILALAAGAAFAGEKVKYEGLELPARKVQWLEAQGYHRYKDTWMTHQASDLKREIDLLNLLNGLYLSDVQMRHLMVIAARAENDRRGAARKAEQLNSTLERMLKEAKAKLVNDEKAQYNCPPPEAQKVQAEISRISGELTEKLVMYQQFAKAVLTPNQREKVYNYQHCLIPVKDLKDPTRIGQADSGSKNEKLLENVKKMTDAQYRAQLPVMLDIHIHGIEYYTGKMSDEAAAKEKARVAEIMQKARSMDDLDFQFTKAKLAADVSSDYEEVKSRLKELAHRLQKLNTEKGQLGDIGRMLLDERVLPIYAKRLSISEGFRAGEAIDLSKVEAAASCKGVCSID